MPIKKVKGSVFNSEDNIIVTNIAALKAITESNREGFVFVKGHTNANDGGGGNFIYSASTPRANDNGGTIFDPTDTGIGNGCWVRIYSLNEGSLNWFGANDNTVSNLLSDYAIEGLQVTIAQPIVGGVFKYMAAEVLNDDGINNFNGWVRQNDSNFTTHLKLNGNRVTKAGVALASDDLVTLAQALELVSTGEFLGVVPMYSPRATGDGVTLIYDTPASILITPPDVNLIDGAAFEVTVNGLKQRHDIDFTVNTTPGPSYGQITFELASVPAAAATVDIVWFAPIVIDPVSDNPITATISGDANLLEDWFGANGKQITVQATGTSAYKNLGDRFAENAIYFDHIAAMQAGHALFKPGMLVVVKGSLVAGDGYLANYFIKTQAQADIDGDDYVTPGTPHILITGSTPDWVAVYQDTNPHLLNEETHVLASAQVEVVFTNEIDIAFGFISGPDVDDAILVKDTDYTLAVDNKTLTLTESFPVGTKISFRWYTPNNDFKVLSVVAGTNVTVDNTDPANPVVSASGGGITAGDIVVGEDSVTTELDLEIGQTTAEDIFSGIVRPLLLNKVAADLKTIIGGVFDAFGILGAVIGCLHDVARTGASRVVYGIMGDNAGSPSFLSNIQCDHDGTTLISAINLIVNGNSAALIDDGAGETIFDMSSINSARLASYADLTAITTAIGTPQVGMVVRVASQGLATYNGTNWVKASDDSTLIV